MAMALYNKVICEFLREIALGKMMRIARDQILAVESAISYRNPQQTVKMRRMITVINMETRQIELISITKKNQSRYSRFLNLTKPLPMVKVTYIHT